MYKTRPQKGGGPLAEMRRIASASIEYGWRRPNVKYLMLAAPFEGGVGIYVFYALQPHLLNLYGDPEAYGVAGLVAAIVAGYAVKAPEREEREPRAERDHARGDGGDPVPDAQPGGGAPRQAVAHRGDHHRSACVDRGRGGAGLGGR